MLAGQSKFSRKGPLSAWMVSWLMIFQHLHPKGTLKTVVGEIRLGSAKEFVNLSDGKKLSRNTSAYSQARSNALMTLAPRLPLAVAENVADMTVP